MKGKSFIDTNIFLYAHDKGDELKQRIARELIFQEYENGNCAVSTQVLAEFFQNFVIKFKQPYIHAMREMHFMSRCRVIEQSISLLMAAAAIFNEHSLSFWDAMVVAAAVESSASILYTEDMNDGQIIEGVKIVNPLPSS